MDQKDAVKMRGESTENGGSKNTKFYSFPSTKILVSFLRETGLFGQFWSEKLAIWSVLKIKLATKKPSIYAGLRDFWSVSQFFSLINVI